LGELRAPQTSSWIWGPLRSGGRGREEKGKGREGGEGARVAP